MMEPLNIFRKIYYCFLSFLILASCQNRSDTRNSDLSTATRSPVLPKDALNTFQVAPGFKIELLAAEPLISDPVDMEIDEYGRLYVVEMHGYPLDKGGSGVVKLLSDSDGDGRMDKSIVFADDMVLPNSVMRWKKGVLITDAPNVLYFEDTTGDGKADTRDTLLTGFALSNPQHNLNSPLLGIDNWIYLAHEGAVSTKTYQNEFGDEGSEIYYPEQPEAPRLAKNASGRSVRFKPGEHLLEETSSKTQFGHSFDVWGNHFLVDNANHIIQEVIAARYIQRNRHLIVPDARQSLSDHANAAEVFSITKDPEHQLLTDVGVITSSCGITNYHGGAFPPPYNAATFVAEPVSNLVHVDQLKDSGATFIASRILSKKEFLASTDSWFRPVNMYTGPDGALYIVDYYRQIIEHPEWMGEEVVKSGELYNGHDRGRIYRISATGAKKAGWTQGLQLGNATNDQLLEQLSNPNSWWRMQAQRLLLDRADRLMIPSLVNLVQTSGSPYARLHALWTLEGMKALKPDVIKRALRDSAAGVRKNAIELSEAHIHKRDIIESLLELQDDPDAKVRFQLLCTLGSSNSPKSLAAIQKLLFRDIHDKWVQVAALSGQSFQTASLLSVVLDSFRTNVPAHASLVQRLGAMMAGDGNREAVRRLIEKGTNRTNAPWQAPLLEGLAQGLKTRKKYLVSAGEQEILIKTFFESPSKDVRQGSLSLLKVISLPDGASLSNAIEKAISTSIDRGEPEDKRVQAIEFVSLGNVAAHQDVLQKLLTPIESASIQVAAIRTLSEVRETTMSKYLLQRWNELSPQVQDEAINAFVSDTARIALLLDAMENNTIQPGAVGWHRSVFLMNHSNLQLRTKARSLLSQTEEEREAVTQQYRQALTLDGEAPRGEKVFRNNCSQCHQVRGKAGNNFGPDLGSVHNWSASAIMVNILAPNLSISSGYTMWDVQQKNGESFQGIISGETPAAITVKNAALETRTIQRADIRRLQVINISAMPVGLEKQIDQQQMADLLAFLKEVK